MPIDGQEEPVFSRDYTSQWINSNELNFSYDGVAYNTNETSQAYQENPIISDLELENARDDLMNRALNRISNRYFSADFASGEAVSVTTNTIPNYENYIKSYNYRPNKFNLNKLSNEDELYIGCELEVAMGGEKDENAKLACDLINDSNQYVYAKHDSSLRDGFEIVTMPCTYEFHKTLNYKKAFDELVNLGYKSHDTSCCGMHMHVNRTFFGCNKLEQDLNIAKLLYLFEKFWTEITYIARRDSNRYAQRFNMEQDDTIMDIYAKSKNHDRYGVINLKNKDTVEIRIYKGTLNYNTFMNTLEFTKKICMFAKKIDIYDVGMVLWKDIEEDFSQELKDYIEDRKTKGNIVSRDNNQTNSSQFFHNLYCSSGRGGRAGSFLYDASLYTSNFDLNSINVMSCELQPYTQPTEEVQLQREITRLREQLRRSRNQLETINLNREIANKETELRRLRRNNRNQQGREE